MGTVQAPWANVQKRFQKTRLHRKTPEGSNIWNYTVVGERRTRELKGIVVMTRKRRWAPASRCLPRTSMWFWWKGRMGDGKWPGTGFAREDEGEWFSNGKGPTPEKGFAATPMRGCGKGPNPCFLGAAHPLLRRAHQRRRSTTGRETPGTHPQGLALESSTSHLTASKASRKSSRGARKNYPMARRVLRVNEPCAAPHRHRGSLPQGALDSSESLTYCLARSGQPWNPHEESLKAFEQRGARPTFWEDAKPYVERRTLERWSE